MAAQVSRDECEAWRTGLDREVRDIKDELGEHTAILRRIESRVAAGGAVASLAKLILGAAAGGLAGWLSGKG